LKSALTLLLQKILRHHSISALGSYQVMVFTDIEGDIMKPFVTNGLTSSTPSPQARGTFTVDYPQLLTQQTRGYPPYLEATTTSTTCGRRALANLPAQYTTDRFQVRNLL
jgi:hypothetical protein